MKLRILLAILIAVFIIVVGIFASTYATTLIGHRCSECHKWGGAGNLIITDSNGAIQSSFNVTADETIVIIAHGTGASEGRPSVAIDFQDSSLYQQVTVNGATKGRDGSYAYYVLDNDADDKDPADMNVKAVFSIIVPSTTINGSYILNISYDQASMKGIVQPITLNVISEPLTSPKPPSAQPEPFTKIFFEYAYIILTAIAVVCVIVVLSIWASRKIKRK